MILQELIERLQKADGPDKVLDALIMQACEPRTGKFGWSAFPYTGSIDSAIAFKNRVLPEYQCGIEFMRDANGGITAWCEANAPHRRHRGATPAIALIIATLRALDEHGEAGR